MHKTVVCHFYNEEYLLPSWLEHHSKIFDRAILIDYASTDLSRKIIIEGRWNTRWNVQLINSINKDFGAFNVDMEVEEIESKIEGWKMCLNVTEFLHGDFRKCTEQPVQHIVPSCMIVDTEWREYNTRPLDLENANTGIPYWVWNERAGRSFHNFSINYPKPGRHYFPPIEAYSKDFMIFHYGWYPLCKQTMDRKLQIQTRIPDYDINNRLGWHHITTKEKLLDKWNVEYKPKIGDISEILNKFRQLTKDSTNY